MSAPRLPQRVGLIGAIHPDHQAEAARLARLHARAGVLHHHRPGRLDPRRRAASRKVSGPACRRDRRSAATLPSTWASKRSAMPAAASDRVAVPARGDHRRGDALSRSSRSHATEPGNTSTPSVASVSSTNSCLRLPMPSIDHSVGGGVRRCPRADRCPGRRGSRAPLPNGASRRRTPGSPRRWRTGESGCRASRPSVEELVEGALPGGGVHARGRGEHAVHVEQDGVEAVGAHDQTRRFCRFGAIRSARGTVTHESARRCRAAPPPTP